MTIRTIAENLGISYSTVSRCLNNDPRVSEKTRQRVLDEAKRIGFTFNVNARSLITKKTNRIGLIYSNCFNEADFRWFFNEIETYATSAVERNSYDYLIQPNNNYMGLSNIARMVSGKMVDGLAIFSRDVSESDFRLLLEEHIPHVFVYYQPPNPEKDQNQFFYSDNQVGGYLATKSLIDRGHQKILSIRSNDPRQKMYDQRTLGYLRAMKEAGLEAKVLKFPMGFDTCKEYIRTNMDEILSYSAVFCQQSNLALSMIQELAKYKIRVPEDISVLGYDDIDLIRYMEMPLDVITDSKYVVISSAIESLVAQMEGREDLVPRCFAPKLLQRASVMDLRSKTGSKAAT